jgi:hypothetical protein
VVTEFSVPTPLVPGQTVTPVIEVANLGTAPTDQQGPVTVQIVASTGTNYGPGDQILATYVIANIPPLSAVTTTVPFGGSLNIQTPSNIVTLDSQSVTLPSTPAVFNLGVKVDPFHTIKQQGHFATARLDAFAKVGPPIPGFVPTTASGSTPTAYTFPNPLPAVTVATTPATVIAPITVPNTPTLSSVIAPKSRRRK